MYSWSSAELPSPILSVNYSLHKVFTIFCANLCLQVAVDNNDPQMCDFIESEFLTEQVCSFGTVDKHMHCRLIVRCNTFKPSLPVNGQTMSTVSITKTSGACTLLTLSAQLSRWKLSRRFQLMCLSLGGLARVMVSSQS